MVMNNGHEFVVGFHSKNQYFGSGACFDSPLVGFGEDLDASIKETARLLKAFGLSYATSRQRSLSDFDIMVFLEMPAVDDAVFIEFRRLNRPCLLVIAENPLIEQKNAQYERYKDFDLVFTYEDRAIAQYGCRRLNYAVRFDDQSVDFVPFAQRRFANMISSRVKKLRPGLVSYQRLWTIRYYEDKHPQVFDLFGIGWDKGVLWCPRNALACEAIAHMRLSRVLPARMSRSWKGTVKKKRDVISQYRFSYCYENTTSIPGYVTEKLFDVLRAGTVPVYLGAPETAQLLPKDIYIDRASFKDDEALYLYLSHMSEAEWMGYIKRGRHFIDDCDLRKPFSVENYAQVLVRGIMDVLALAA
jgi:alpha(1,3/1,4) fucosyltransferase